MNIQELKLKSSEQLITQAEELGIENASTLRKQEILFAILKKVAEKEEITLEPQKREKDTLHYYKLAKLILKNLINLDIKLLLIT